MIFGGHSARRSWCILMPVESKYDPRFHPVVIKYMVRCGLTVDQIVAELEIGKTTLNRWRRKHLAVAKALRENRDFIDALVEDSLVRRALGYDYVAHEHEVGKGERGMIDKRKLVTKHVPSEVVAAIFWLTNRRPDRWRRNPEPPDSEAQAQALDALVDILQQSRDKINKRKKSKDEEESNAEE